MAKLLVSDDDPQVLDLVTLVLEDAGHTVVATGDLFGIVTPSETSPPATACRLPL